MPEREPLVIAADLGASKLAVEVRGQNLETCHYAYRKDLTGLDYRQIIDLTVTTIAAAAADHKVKAVGAAVAGQVDAAGSVSHRAVSAPGVKEGLVAALPVQSFPLAALLADATGLPCAVDNDANCAAIAEWRYGAAKGVNNFVALTVGTFTGSAVVANGLLSRRRTSGPLIGGILIPYASSADGFEHLGVLVGGHMIEQLAAQIPRWSQDAPIRAATVVAYARADDPDARDIISQVRTWFHLLVTAAVNVFDPELVLLSGSLISGASDLLLDGLDAFLECWRLPGAADPPVTRLGRYEDAGLVGAVILAFDKLRVDASIVLDKERT